jgi:hypothetical protein
MKETKEILENILRIKKSEYEILEPSTSSVDSKPTKRKKREKTNVLTNKSSRMLSDEGPMEDIEEYKPTQEMHFEVDEVKDFQEKKKKRRNYIEFRPDYEKS